MNAVKYSSVICNNIDGARSLSSAVKSNTCARVAYLTKKNILIVAGSFTHAGGVLCKLPLEKHDTRSQGISIVLL